MSLATDCARAIVAGQNAARAGQPPTDCPHDHNGPTARERVLAALWVRGYDRVRPAPIDYSG